MNQETLNGHKKKLEAEKVSLMAEVDRVQKPSDFGSDIDGFDEKTDEAEEIGNQESIAAALKDRMGEIDVALSKINSGTYGVCEKCGNEIEEEVLKVNPESRFCKACNLAE